MARKYFCESCQEEITNPSVLTRRQGQTGRKQLFHRKFFGINVSTGAEEYEICGPVKQIANRNKGKAHNT